MIVDSELASVVVDYQASEAVDKMVTSLFAGTRVPAHVVIVDNAQTDTAYASLISVPPGVELHVVRPDRNVGFAGGCNAGAQRACLHGVDRIAFINPDVIVSNDAIQALCDGFNQNPERLSIAGVLEHGGFYGTPFLGGETHYSRLTGRAGQHHGELAAPRQTVPFLHGAFFMVDAAAYQRVGGMEESFFLYREEVDFFLRLGSSMMIDDLVGTHAGGVSTGTVGSRLRVGFMSRNYIKLALRHAGVFLPLWVLRWLVVESAAILLRKGPSAMAHHLQAPMALWTDGEQLAKRWSAS